MGKLFNHKSLAKSLPVKRVLGFCQTPRAECCAELLSGMANSFSQQTIYLVIEPTVRIQIQFTAHGYLASQFDVGFPDSFQALFFIAHLVISYSHV